MYNGRQQTYYNDDLHMSDLDDEQHEGDVVIEQEFVIQPDIESDNDDIDAAVDTTSETVEWHDVAGVLSELPECARCGLAKTLCFTIPTKDDLEHISALNKSRDAVDAERSVQETAVLRKHRMLYAVMYTLATTSLERTCLETVFVNCNENADETMRKAAYATLSEPGGLFGRVLCMASRHMEEAKLAVAHLMHILDDADRNQPLLSTAEKVSIYLQIKTRAKESLSRILPFGTVPQARKRWRATSGVLTKAEEEAIAKKTVRDSAKKVSATLKEEKLLLKKKRDEDRAVKREAALKKAAENAEQKRKKAVAKIEANKERLSAAEARLTKLMETITQ